MLKKWALGAAMAALVATGVAVPSPAAAAVPTAQVFSLSKVYLVDGHPLVSGTYSCTGRLSHLWVSAKQGKGDLSQEGSGAQARAWWDRTIDNRLNCDGRTHTITVRLQRRDNSGNLIADPRGRLAWVQFCLLTANRRSGFEEGGNSSFASIMKWRHVSRL